jgi:hypothetical protein
MQSQPIVHGLGIGISTTTPPTTPPPVYASDAGADEEKDTDRIIVGIDFGYAAPALFHMLVVSCNSNISNLEAPSSNIMSQLHVTTLPRYLQC